MNGMEFGWDGRAMLPANRKLAESTFVIGEVYYLEPRFDRSAASHRHYFAALHQAWENLPEHLTDRFPTVEHLRKYGLISTGYRDERTFVCHDRHEAMRLAAFMRPMDEYAVVVVHEAAVLVLTAKSQSLKAMGKKDFQQSKDAVLDCVAGLIGVSPIELRNMVI